MSRHWIDHERARAGLPPRDAARDDAAELAMWRQFSATFSEGVAAFLAGNPEPGHPAHRFLDMHWTDCTQRILPDGHPMRVQTAAWMAMIEGQHDDGKPYP